MQKDGDMLDVVDKDGNILYQETRKKIHEEGLMHREVHVWLFTSNKELIFQHRSNNKDTYPGLLDASVGGHVEIGDTWIKSALKEVKEETGISADKKSLHFIEQTHTVAKDELTGMINNALRKIYALHYEGDIAALVVEKGKCLGFVAYGFEELRNLDEKEAKRFIPSLTTEKYHKLYDRIESIYLNRITDSQG